MTVIQLTHPYVYRAYCHDGLLGYVGSTRQLWQRLAAHRQKAWWAPTIARVRAELHPTVEAAQAAERAAVLAEAPRWNRQEFCGREAQLPQQQLHDFVYGWAASLVQTEMHGHWGRIRDTHVNRLARYQHMYLSRFGVPLDIDFDSIDIYATSVPVVTDLAA